MCLLHDVSCTFIFSHCLSKFYPVRSAYLFQKYPRVERNKEKKKTKKKFKHGRGHKVHFTMHMYRCQKANFSRFWKKNWYWVFVLSQSAAIQTNKQTKLQIKILKLYASIQTRTWILCTCNSMLNRGMSASGVREWV